MTVFQDVEFPPFAEDGERTMLAEIRDALRDLRPVPVDPADLPRALTFTMFGSWPAAGNLLLTPQWADDGPTQGYVWHVMNWQVAPAGAKTTSNAVVDLYSGPFNPTTPSDGDIGAMWRDSSRGSVLPFGNTKGKYEFTLHPGEGMWAVVSGGTAGEIYTLTVWCLQEREP